MKPFFCILQPETETFHARQHLPLLGPFTKKDVSWLLLFSHVHLSSSCFTGSKWQLLLVALAGVSMMVTLTCPPCLPRRVCASGSAFPLPWCCPAASAGIWGLSPSEDGCQARSCSHFVLMHIAARLGTSVLAAFGSRSGCL